MDLSWNDDFDTLRNDRNNRYRCYHGLGPTSSVFRYLQHHAMLFSNDCFINRVGNWMQSSGTLRVFDPGWIRTGWIVAGSGHDGESIVRTSIGY